MKTMKILIPTDFSVQAEYAFVLAKRIEEKIPLEIHFLHVLSVPDTVTMDPMGNIQTCGDIDAGFVEGQKQIALRKLKEIRNQYGDSIQTHLRLGKLTDEIIGFAKSQAFDLIVMGTKGSWGLQEKLSGSETQMVTRLSEVPVLSMMCDRSDLEIKNVVLVHDFTLSGNENISVLKSLVKAFNAKVHLLHITDASSDENAIQAGMDRYAQVNGFNQFEKHTIKDLNVEQGVTHFNQMHQIDLVCIGTHGLTGINRFLHPSATEKMVNHLFKPILTFHLQKA
jgi:nucleotide-binding universal stress UspA family protein